MTDKKVADKATPAALIATAIIAIAGNTNLLSDKGADKTLVHGLIVRVQADIRSAHDHHRNMEERQRDFESFVQQRLDELEADILVDDKDDSIPPPTSPRFDPPEPPPVYIPPPAKPVDDLLRD